MCVFCFRAIVNVALNISTMVDRKDKTEKKKKFWLQKLKVCEKKTNI